MIKGFETTPMFGAQLFGGKMFSPQDLTAAFTQGMPQGFSAFSSGAGEINRAIVEYSKHVFEDGAATYGEMMRSKSLEEAFQIQSRYAQRTMNEYVQHVQRVSSLYMRWAETAFMPQSLTFPRN